MRESLSLHLPERNVCDIQKEILPNSSTRQWIDQCSSRSPSSMMTLTFPFRLMCARVCVWPVRKNKMTDSFEKSSESFSYTAISRYCEYQNHHHFSPAVLSHRRIECNNKKYIFSSWLHLQNKNTIENASSSVHIPYWEIDKMKKKKYPWRHLTIGRPNRCGHGAREREIYI